MRHMRGPMLGVILLLALLTGCDSFWPAAETPTGTPVPTATSTVTPTATLADADGHANAGVFAYGDCRSDRRTVGGKAVVVAQHEGKALGGDGGVDARAGSRRRGRDYAVEVTSRAGAVAYTGSYSNAATDANGLPVLGRERFRRTHPRVGCSDRLSPRRPLDLFYLGSNDGEPYRGGDLGCDGCPLTGSQSMTRMVLLADDQRSHSMRPGFNVFRAQHVVIRRKARLGGR